MCAIKQLGVFSVAAAVVVLLSACAMDAGPQPKSKLDASAVTAVGVKSDAEENITDLTEVLDCVGTQVATFGSKSFILVMIVLSMSLVKNLCQKVAERCCNQHLRHWLKKVMVKLSGQDLAAH